MQRLSPKHQFSIKFENLLFLNTYEAQYFSVNMILFRKCRIFLVKRHFYKDLIGLGILKVKKQHSQLKAAARHDLIDPASCAFQPRIRFVMFQAFSTDKQHLPQLIFMVLHLKLLLSSVTSPVSTLLMFCFVILRIKYSRLFRQKISNKNHLEYN